MNSRFLGHRKLAAVTAAALLAAGAAACGSSSSTGSSNSNSNSSATGTLTMESSPESTITQAFNPFVPTQAIFGMGADGLIYEPLLQFNIASPPKYYPWLATSYKWSNGGKTVTFAIRPGVKFNNGTPMTPADVVFTYNLVKANKAINLAGLNISSVSASGNNVTLTFPTSQYTNLQSIAGVPILPQAIWSKVGNPATYADANPVGTGPYKLKSFTPQGFTLTKNTGYWQASQAKVLNVYFPVYTSNTGALSALFNDQIDWTGNFIPGLQKDFVAKDPAHHHYWEAPGSTNAFIPNLNKWPTNQLPVRQAISLAVDRTVLATEGEAGLENPVLNATGITLPTYSAWSAPVASKTVSAHADAAAAQAVLKKAGYTKGGDGLWVDSSGQKVTFQIVTFPQHPSATPIAPIVTQQLKRGGFDASFLLPADFVSRITTGDAASFLWGHGGAMKDPYKTLDLYNARYVKPTPTPIFFTNMYRWSNQQFSDLVDQMGKLPEDDPGVMPLWQQAMQNWLPELPDIPLIQTVIALPMNTTYWTNWPQGDHPYIHEGFWHRTGLHIFLNLKPAQA